MSLVDREARLAYQRAWTEKNRARLTAEFKEKYHANKEFFSDKGYNWRKNNPQKAIWRRIRQRARIEGLDFDLIPEDIVIPQKCPALGIDMHIGRGRQHDASPSVDRIDPKKGYVRGNIVVISFLANRIKSNATVEQVESVARWMRNGIIHSDN